MKLEIKNISKKFNDNLVLDNINMQLTSNNIYGFSGRNGSGKSVLLKIISGLYFPTTGNIFLNDKKIDYHEKFLPSLGVLIESPKFFHNLTCYENLEIIGNISKKIEKEDILRVLEIVNLISEKDKKFSKCSLGMKQKLGIASAIINDPDILILDEPFNGIEEASVLKIKEYLKSIKNNKIIILSTHNKEDLEELSKQIFYFDNGKVCIKWKIN